MARMALTKYGSSLLVVLAVSFLGCSKNTSEEEDRLQALVMDEAPSIPQKLEVSFGDKVTLLGYKFEGAKKAKAKDKGKITFYWRVDSKLDKDTYLTSQLVSDRGDVLVKADNIGALRQKRDGKFVMDPSTWKPGKIYVDEQTIRYPDKLVGKSVKILVGLMQAGKNVKPKGGNADKRGMVTAMTLGVDEPPQKVGKVPQITVSAIEDKQIKVDGKLDEEVWKTAVSLPNLVNLTNDKAPAADAAYRAAAKLLWSPKALYVALEVHDEDVDGGFKKTAKEPPLWKRDTFELIGKVDGLSDNKNYYRILVGPQNLLFDSFYTDFKFPMDPDGSAAGDRTWTSKTKAASVINGTIDDASDVDQGYVQEIEIPWASFDRGQPFVAQVGAAVWLNFAVRSRADILGFSAYLGDSTMHASRRFGKLVLAAAGTAPTPPATTAPLYKDLPKLPAPPPKEPAKAADGTAPAAANGVPAPVGVTAPKGPAAAPKAPVAAPPSPATGD